MKRLLFFVWLVCFGAQAATFYVRKDGHDTASGANDTANATTGAFLTVQKAVDSASAGDTILAGPGNYAENVRTADWAGTAGNLITINGQNQAAIGSFTWEQPYINIINWTNFT